MSWYTMAKTMLSSQGLKVLFGLVPSLLPFNY